METVLDENWIGVFNNVKEFENVPLAFTGKPKLPTKGQVLKLLMFGKKSTRMKAPSTGEISKMVFEKSIQILEDGQYSCDGPLQCQKESYQNLQITLEVPGNILVDPEVTAMLDRTKLTNLKVAGENLNDFVISQDTLIRERKRKRKVIAAQGQD